MKKKVKVKTIGRSYLLTSIKNFMDSNLSISLIHLKMMLISKKKLDRIRGNYNLPEMLIPEYIESMKYKHGSQFKSNNDNLYRESTNFLLHSELSEQIFSIPVFARRSVGPCKCLQNVDGTKFLIWNLGNRRFIDFTLLHSYM